MHMHQVDPSSKLIGSNFDLGSQGSKGFFHQKRGDLFHPPNLTRALGKGRMSSGIFALTRFLTICFFFYKLPRILTKLGQILQLVSSYKSYQQFDPKRYVGVTGVKSILKIQFYWKCFFSFILDSRGTWFMHIIKLKTLYKTYCLIFLNGVIWGH